MSNLITAQKILLCLFVSFLAGFHARAGTVSSPYTYAWSDNVGYVNFAGVVVDDDVLSGHAWSANSGFIVFDPDTGGVQNDDGGDLSGFAWGEQLGWVDFDGVHIDEDGRFSGMATGDLIGRLTFDCPDYCDVRTDWRPALVAGATTVRGPSFASVSRRSPIAVAEDLQKSERLPSSSGSAIYGEEEVPRALFDIAIGPGQAVLRHHFLWLPLLFLILLVFFRFVSRSSKSVLKRRYPERINIPYE